MGEDSETIETTIDYLVPKGSKGFLPRRSNGYEDGLLFVTCKDEKLSNGFDCDIRTKWLKDPHRNQTCSIKRAVDDGNILIVGDFPVTLDFLGSYEKIMISWNEVNEAQKKVHEKIVIVNMTNCDGSKQLNFSHNMDFSINDVVIHQNVFDRFASKLGYDKNYVIYKTTHNEDGSPIGRAQTLTEIKPKQLGTMYAMQPQENVTSWFIALSESSSNQEIRHGLIAGSKNDPKNGTQLNFDETKSYSKDMPLGISSAYGMLTICGLQAPMAKHSVICHQFFGKNYELKAAEKLDFLQETVAFDVKNIEENKTLLLRFEYNEVSKEGNLSGNIYIDGFNITEIDYIKEYFDFKGSKSPRNVTVAIVPKSDGICCYLSYILESMNSRDELVSNSSIKLHEFCKLK